MHQLDAEVDNARLAYKKNPCFVSALPLENEDESSRRLCEYWRSIFQARVEGPRHHKYDDILRYVQKAPDDIRWIIDRTEFDELIAMKKDSALDPDGIPYGAYRCAEGWAHSSYLTLTSFCWKKVPFQNISLEVGRSLSPRPLTRISRYPEALRPLTQCNCDCKLLTSAICRGPPLENHDMHTSFAEMYLFQANDGQHL